MEEQIVSEDWVGPITAYLEFWEAGPFEPRQRGERVVSRLLILFPWSDRYKQLSCPNAPADFVPYP